MQCWRGANLVAQARQVAQQASSCLPASNLPATPQTQKQLSMLAICIGVQSSYANTCKNSWHGRKSFSPNAVGDIYVFGAC